MVVEDFSLTGKDKITLAQGEWLYDLHINILLKADFLEVGSLQTPLLHFETFCLVQRENDILAEVLLDAHFSSSRKLDLFHSWEG